LCKIGKSPHASHEYCSDFFSTDGSYIGVLWCFHSLSRVTRASNPREREPRMTSRARRTRRPVVAIARDARGARVILCNIHGVTIASFCVS